jgi:hypothetical protein
MENHKGKQKGKAGWVNGVTSSKEIGKKSEKNAYHKHTTLKSLFFYSFSMYTDNYTTFLFIQPFDVFQVFFLLTFFLLTFTCQRKKERDKLSTFFFVHAKSRTSIVLWICVTKHANVIEVLHRRRWCRQWSQKSSISIKFHPHHSAIAWWNASISLSLNSTQLCWRFNFPHQ